MTVTLQYAPEKTPWTGTEREIDFLFECSGPGAFEVWLETESAVPGVYNRVLVSPQNYNVAFNGGKPTYVAGTVSLTGTIADTVDFISLERNTLITQAVDLQNFGSFMMPNLEYMLDKMTMIIQELMVGKCGLQNTTPPLQPYRFEPYAVLSQRLVNDPLEVIAFYCQALYNLGEDCTSDPANA